MGPNARVWQIYLDEADQYDSEMVEGVKDTTDVLLVFVSVGNFQFSYYMITAAGGSFLLSGDYLCCTIFTGAPTGLLADHSFSDFRAR